MKNRFSGHSAPKVCADDLTRENVQSMQRPGTAEEVAESIVWLLSDSASYTTGALLDVAGGR